MRIALPAWIVVLGVGIVSPASQRTSVVRHAPDGHPDLQGIWDNSIITPLERPKELGDKRYLTEEEAVELEQHPVEYYRKLLGTVEGQTTGELNESWSEQRRKVLPDRRTSLIVDPPSGRIPALTPQAQRRNDAAAEWQKQHPADGPEDLEIRERCILWGAGPPLIPVPFNYVLQIVQTRDYVMILTEMIHDARLVPLDGRPHLPSTIRQWKGDSRGRWDGDTLVVDTTNFIPSHDERFFSDEQLHVVERFKLSDSDTLLYEFTVEDPTAFTQSWSAKFPMTRTKARMFEYACHEANYSMVGILRGARAAEKQQHDR
jgi:hypothetical protein